MNSKILGKVYKPVVVDELSKIRPARVLDLPSGNGWLRQEYKSERMTIDGIDLFKEKPGGYSGFWAADLDDRLPVEDEEYDAVVTCEGIEHIGNPLLFLQECLRSLVPGGTIVVSTPNVWGPASRLKYLFRGFFSGFPSLAGKVQRGTHMHIQPFSFPRLFLYLRLAGFEEIGLKETAVRKPRHGLERPLAWPQRRYCRKQERKALTEEELLYWRDAGSNESIYGRAMVVTARKPD